MKSNPLDRISSFSLILVMVVLMIIGVALVPMLHLSYEPSPKQGQRLTVSVSWAGASAQVLEAQVVSPIEATLATVVGVDEISSSSQEEHGNVYITLKEGVNVASKRFEIATLLRQVGESLPTAAHYNLSGGAVNSGSVNERLLLSYTINADAELSQISEHIRERVIPSIKEIENVSNVWLTGSSPTYLDIEYNPQSLARYGLDARDIATGVSDLLGRSSIVGDVDIQTPSGEMERITLLLQTEQNSDLSSVPLGLFDGRMIYLRDVAQVKSKVRSAEHYYRINGMNTLSMNIYIDGDANVISMSNIVQEAVGMIHSQMNKGYHLTIASDAADKIRAELNSLIKRTLLSLLILLLFVLVVSRSWRYLSIIAITLAANVLISVILYYLFDVELHLFSLAGVTVSFGIIIDTSIVMVDHYSYYRNRSVFTAILAALITTIGSLVIIFFMPDYIKDSLTDFAAVIIINLSASLLISLLFVPALIDKMKVRSSKKSRRSSRLVVRWSRLYTRYIYFTQRRKWIYITILVLAFGLPLFALPEKLGEEPSGPRRDEEQPPLEWYEKLYNSSIGSDLYQQSLREPMEKILGGTLRLFSTSLSSRTFFGGERQTELTITARLTEGNDGDGNGALLNEKMLEMDRFLASFDKIQRFETTVNGDSGNIRVQFADSVQHSSFPQQLEAEVISRAISIGGVDWSTYGVSERGFSNSLNLDRKSYSIELTGYNYQRLREYAVQVASIIESNSRAEDVAVEDGTYGYGSRTERGIALNYDSEKIALYGIDLHQTHQALAELLNSEQLGTYRKGDMSYEIDYHSSERNRFDMWSLMNQYLMVGDDVVRFSNIASIGERNARQVIDKRNQEYTISVAFNFLGSYTLADKFTTKTIESANEMLPVGFSAKNRSWGWYNDQGEQYWLILLIVVIIFFMCSILFESLRLPLVIISLIPISFIGTFLTYYFSKVEFGTGGFASLVLLSGLVVNSAIYLINEYNTQSVTNSARGSARLYVRAYNHKILPILLTVLSTALGLIPFLVDGAEKNGFWFSFAIGSISGLLFSVVALVLFMPILMKLNESSRVKI